MQNLFKSILNKISKGRYKSEEQRSALNILRYFMMHEKLLLNYLIIILYTIFFYSKLGFCLELGLLNSETEIGTGVA